MPKTCFIISSIGEEESDTRKRVDMIYDLMFEPILKDLGYEVTRADKIGSPGLITREIVKQIINSDLIIADVSDQNPNVFYELAIRNMVKKPVIVIKGLNQKMPFDIYDKRAISLDTTNPRIWENAKKALKIQIQDAENKPLNASESILSDINFEIDTAKKPKVEEADVELRLKDLSQEMRRFRDEVARINRIPNPEYIPQQISFSSPGIIVTIELGSGAAPTNENQRYLVPKNLTINRGQTVLWINNDSVSHTITSGKPDNSKGNEVAAVFDSSLLSPGATFSHTFQEKGTFEYFDQVHPWVTGVVNVR